MQSQDNYASLKRGRGYFIRCNSETKRGVTLEQVTNEGTNVLLQVNNGYIVADSYFNSVNYNTDCISVHVRYAECENPQMQYLYDRIYIITGKGEITGHFWFRDLATYISSKNGFFKHMKYFYFYFNSVQQVYVTKGRLVMVFPTTSPLGLKVVSDGYMQWHIHPEYLPKNKLKSMVISYNFLQDKDFELHDADYEMTDLLYEGRDLFDSEIDDIPGWNHSMTFEQIKNFNTMMDRDPETGESVRLIDKTVYLDGAFEMILSLPDSLIDMTGIAEEATEGEPDNYFRAALPPERTFKDIMVSQSSVESIARMNSMGSMIAPKIQPTMSYIGSDSSILGVSLKGVGIDVYLNATQRNHEMALDILSEYPDIQNALAILDALAETSYAKTDISFSRYSNNLHDVFTRIGPHCYIYITPQGVAFPVIEYQEQYYYFNNMKVASGNRPYIWGEIINLCDEKYIRFGRSVYKDQGGEPEPVQESNPYSWNTHCTKQELKLFKYFDDLPYTTKIGNNDILIGTENGNDIIMLNWLNKRYIQKTNTGVNPILTFGDNVLVGVYSQGSLSKACVFYTLDTTLKVFEKEGADGNKLIPVIPLVKDFYYFTGIQREILELKPGYSGFFCKTTDGNAEQWWFISLNGKMTMVKDVVTYEYNDWFIVKADEADACNPEDSYSDLRAFLKEEMKGDKIESINDVIDSIEVIGGEMI